MKPGSKLLKLFVNNSVEKFFHVKCNNNCSIKKLNFSKLSLQQILFVEFEITQQAGNSYYYFEIEMMNGAFPHST